MAVSIKSLASVVLQVGSYLLELRAKKKTAGIWKGSQFKAEADLAANTMLIDCLKELDASIPCISEEDGPSRGMERPVRYWLIDPIDGTRSFAEGFPGFVTQVALMDRCSPVLAAVFAPVHNDLFLAERGKGAFLNGERLQVREARSIDILIDNYPEPSGIAERAYRLLGMKAYIESGSIGLKLCRVAQGLADLFIKDVQIQDWDVAPGDLIISEAGGVVTDLNGKPLPYQGDFARTGLIACNSLQCIESIRYILCRQ